MDARDHRLWALIGGIAAALVIGFMIGNARGTAVSTTYIPAPTATVTVTKTATPPAVAATVVVTTTTLTPPAKQPPVATITDGTWLLGTDIRPGTYRSTNDEDNCYWARLSDTLGTSDSIIANENPDGPAVVTISPSDAAFQSKRCGTWTLIG